MPPADAAPESTFRDHVELGLTIIFGLAFLVTLGFAIFYIGKQPLVYDYGDEKNQIEPFVQATTVIATVTPFLTTIIGFWFGKTSESKVAKKETDRADKAVNGKEVADKAVKVANVKLQNIQGMVTREKVAEQARIKRAAEVKAVKIAGENDPMNILNELAGTTLENKINPSLLATLAAESNLPQVLSHLTSLEGEGSTIEILDAIQAVLD